MSKRDLTMLLVFVVLLAAAGALGYYQYKRYFSPAKSQPAPATEEGTPAATTPEIPGQPAETGKAETPSDGQPPTATMPPTEEEEEAVVVTAEILSPSQFDPKEPPPVFDAVTVRTRSDVRLDRDPFAPLVPKSQPSITETFVPPGTPFLPPGTRPTNKTQMPGGIPEKQVIPPQKVEPLDFKLLGVAHSDGHSEAVLLIGEETFQVAVNDVLFDKYLIFDIQEDHVVVRRLKDQRIYYVNFGEGN